MVGVDEENNESKTVEEEFKEELTRFRHLPMNAVAHPFFSKCGEIINTVSGKMNDHNSYYINNVGLKSCNGIVDENSIEECVPFTYACTSGHLVICVILFHQHIMIITIINPPH